MPVQPGKSFATPSCARSKPGLRTICSAAIGQPSTRCIFRLPQANCSMRQNEPRRIGSAGRETTNQKGKYSMTMAVTHEALSESDHNAQLRKGVIASTIGTAIEWYDFFLYGTAAGLIFGKLYFPNQDVLTATLAAFATYFIGFIA